jgi:leucyl-tRNA synthetase
MSGYNFKEIEEKWQQLWQAQNVYQSKIDRSKPKFYALDMFPYPSGAGLHVGHPLGYIASDIVSRYKRLNGYNVLHPMGFDAFGLPAEQYAIQTGQHPAITTEKNIARYKEQLNRIGFSFDWSREVQTCDPSYYKWTQWIFIQLFESWYNAHSNKAESIDQLILIFENEGNANVQHWGDEVENFSSEEWEKFSSLEKENILQCYRLAYQKETTVNWCEELGTVLANDEVKDGKSERGGHPVTQKLMKQWYLRITAYADRLLSGLDTIAWSDSLKEMQRNWIGKSEGATLKFNLQNHKESLEVFTTRPDTLFGATFMVIAPEHELANQLITTEQKKDAEAYIQAAVNKTERERMMNKEVSGAFTGSYAIHPFTEEKLPVYIAEYVLGGYGTGAIMAVPAHDERDYKFAKHFGLEIVPVIDGGVENDYAAQSYDSKEGILINSHNFNRLSVQEGTSAIIQLAEERGFGKRQTNYKLRDAGFSRQRYWGEPFPIIYQEGVPTVVNDLPVELPEVESYKPTGTGESPLAGNTEWVQTTQGKRETDTMPGYAGSSWYFLRYMDPQNKNEFAGKESLEYWNQVDLYIGGTEHATGHLLYARFWTKFLFDRGYISFEEPFKQLVNQGMIQGESMLLNTNNRLIHVPVALANKDATLTKEQFEYIAKTDNRFDGLNWDSLVGSDNLIHLETQVEKMSKSKFNVVNPDDICNEYGADTLRLYEMFLGPLQDSKPWSTKGIDGTHRFLKKLWALFYNQDDEQQWNESEPSKDSLKTLHQTIKKVTEDIQNFSFNTSVSQFMICVNELGTQKCTSKSILENLLVLLAPFAPHIAEELWHRLGNDGLVIDANWPQAERRVPGRKYQDLPYFHQWKNTYHLGFTLRYVQRRN